MQKDIFWFWNMVTNVFRKTFPTFPTQVRIYLENTKSKSGSEPSIHCGLKSPI